MSRRERRAPLGSPRHLCSGRARRTPRQGKNRERTLSSHEALVRRARADGRTRGYDDGATAAAATRDGGVTSRPALPRHPVRNRQLPAELPSRMRRHDGDVYAPRGRGPRLAESLPRGLARGSREGSGASRVRATRSRGSSGRFRRRVLLVRPRSNHGRKSSASAGRVRD